MEQELGPGSNALRPIQRQIGIAMVRKSLVGYESLSATERQARLNALRAFAAAMGFQTGTAAPLTPGAPNPVAEAAESHDSFRKGMEQFKRDLLDGGLNAQDRSALSKMAQDLHAKRQRS